MRYVEEFRERLERIFGDRAEDVYRYLLEGRPPTYVRVNTLKADVEEVVENLETAGVELAETPLSYAFRVLSSPGPLGSSLEHVAGYLYLQDLASMVPPELLDPEPPGPVIDLCAAPGSKTTQLAQLLGGEGVVLAVDADPRRVRALVHNVNRLGCVNVIVAHADAARLRISAPFLLLDPPCSGEGTLHRDPHALRTWTPKKPGRFARTQLRLLRAALRMLPPGGRLVYSTCTFSVEENELVIHEALGNDDRYRIVPSVPRWLEPHTVPGLTEWEGRELREDLRHAFRIDPASLESDGFFVAVIERRH
ncbi:RsmB/NOP family class I SAM-dependent RNA methyltransferase [Methanopyrus kandleri]|uniref:tRNA/rRNA cytosine-C5-methylase n=2 Tax=Methanopyrus kandleri TaxID=2320 RepID=Q8TGZ3_METKA|nr:RsmB/NOP family class I SAM-dependent RNA methyltransferase [Methanopyrus kandleri]AAM01888.1 tRNA/rRNA cytosine-C5-methylase [Methanopyrus kandleri AV19]HII70102.1 RsmB/NOP family class I SAM-dependent RNA methyltransferase [Methanopyrus kandleri]